MKIKEDKGNENDTEIFIVVHHFVIALGFFYSSWWKTTPPPRTFTNSNNVEYKCDYKSSL